jgi:type I restriction enzyme, R subunit
MSSKETSNFGFLQSEWPQLFAEGQKSEALVVPDPRTACFYARRALEIAVTWLYTSDSAFKLPYQDNLSALIHEPTFKGTVGQKIFIKAKLIKDLGNLAAHSHKPFAATGLDDRSARAVSYLLLAGTHVFQDGEASGWPDV